MLTAPHSGGGRHVPPELQRQMSLDQLKLLDAILCCHPVLLPRFLALPDLPTALAVSLLRAADTHVRKQAALFVVHLVDALETAPPHPGRTHGAAAAAAGACTRRQGCA